MLFEVPPDRVDASAYRVPANSERVGQLIDRVAKRQSTADLTVEFRK
jgi:hypothetical protein